MFRLIVTNDEEVVKFARERGAGVFIAEKLPIILIIALHLFFRKDILPDVGIYP